MNVASDASPLIWLSQVGHFALLQALFAAVYIAPAVRAETVERATGYPNAELVRAACEAGWMVVVPPQDTHQVTVLQIHVARRGSRNGRDGRRAGRGGGTGR